MASGMHSQNGMRYSCVILGLFSGVLSANTQQPQIKPAPGPQPIVVSISISGAQNYQLSQELLQRIQGLIGHELNQAALDDLAQSVGNELHDYSVTQRVTPGDAPDQVKVVLELAPRAGSDAPTDADVNVNSRYTVEDVQVKGVKKDRLSKQLMDDLQHMVGAKLNPQALDDLMQRLTRELHARRVARKVLRGDVPDHVKIVIEVSLRRKEEPELQLSKGIYDSKQGWSGKIVADIEHETILWGIASDADDLLERYAGIIAGLQAKKVVTDRLRMRFLFQDYHQQWNPTTLAAIESRPDVPGIYRTRRIFEPTLTISLPGPFTATIGSAFNFVQIQYPAARTQAANAATGSLRYHQRFESADGIKHDVSGGYNVRAATRSFDSDFVYTRHEWNFRYKISGNRQAFVVSFTAGRLSGRAPLFDRYLLGTSTTLRGWNKFDLAPVGGDRMVHNSIEYRHKMGQRKANPGLMAFYDVGSVWDHGERMIARHSAGGGVRWGENFFLALGFPIRTGRAEPILMVGTTF
jgi:hemolysin activation/secretion protein